MRKKAFTIVELLIALMIFTSVSVIAVNIFVNIMRIQGRIYLENAIYEDARFMMERISREIRNNAVDYEEYFNQGIDETHEIGALYGCYAAQFYDPGIGKDGDTPPTFTNPGDLGALCNDGTRFTGQGCVLYRPSLDRNTGQFPYLNLTSSVKNAYDSNAFCPYLHKPGVCSSENTSDKMKRRDTLYLISKDGRRKTIMASKQIGASPDEYALGYLVVEGKDHNTDGIVESWSGSNDHNPADPNAHYCAAGFDCPDKDASAPETVLPNLEASLDGPTHGTYTGFIPISPLRTNIVSLDFIVKPVEDPRKAFAEGDFIEQPRVTVLLKVTPSADQLNRYGNPDIAPTITLQNTISSRVQTNVNSYLGADSNDKCSTVL